MDYRRKGVFGNISNIEKRNELVPSIGPNIGIYKQFKDYLSHGIGEMVEIHERSLSSLTKGKSILDYTHDGESQYSKDIYADYFNGVADLDVIDLKEIYQGERIRWKGKRPEYVGLHVLKGKISADLGADVVIIDEGFTADITDPKHDDGKTLYAKLSTFYKNDKPYVTTNRTEDDWNNLIMPFSYDGMDDFGVEQYIHARTKDGKILHNVYGEGDTPSESGVNNSFDDDEIISDFDDYTHSFRGENNLLKKTDRLFNSHKIKTLFGRFVTSNDDGYNEIVDSFDTAKRVGLGNSHGRSLLRLGIKSGSIIPYTNGYYDPFCRAWTYHHEYSRYSDTLRNNSGKYDETFVDKYSSERMYRSRYPEGKEGDYNDPGDVYLKENTVLDYETNLVRITPTKEEYNKRYDETNGNHTLNDVKKYMFSIENLAWSDGTSLNKTNLSHEQLGPNLGRIMWFPPYDLKFSESINAKYNENTFIGRGENVYTYSNTSREGSLSFTLLIDHPSIMNSVNNPSYNGEAPDYDVENDILRYFAGCHEMNPDGVRPEDKAYMYADPYPNEYEFKYGNPSADMNTDTTEETSKPKEDNSGYDEVTFRVYFPNNYSGHFNKPSPQSRPVDKQDRKKLRTEIDTDWMDYLMFGKGCDNVGNGNGYEREIGSGISYDGTSLVNSNGERKALSANEEADFYVRNTAITLDDAYTFKYRTDFDLRQKLIADTGRTNGIFNNYIDKDTFKLNHDFDKETYLSFEVYYALATNYKFVTAYREQKSEIAKTIFSPPNIANIFNSEEMVAINEKIKVMFKFDQNGNVTGFRRADGIELYGNATDQDSPNTQELATRRAITIASALQKEELSEVLPTSFNLETATVKFRDLNNAESGSDRSINTRPRKSERYAEITLKYRKSTENSDVKDAPTNETALKNIEGQLKEANNRINVFEESLKAAEADERRYDNEYRFFSRLENNDPLLFKKIKDKVKYFNPAFHSISPEGFNARLTFLQQCTRQGHTCSLSDGKFSATAGNLAFGKMPVCVLRLGDFINTRILIKNISIDYSNGGATQWDLNPEGIGVQPVYASVRMSIIIIGGQSLEGPVSRLQNAVTFDYYANAGVYDDRADIVRNEGNGKNEYVHIFTPYKTNNYRTLGRSDSEVEAIKKMYAEQNRLESEKQGIEREIRNAQNEKRKNDETNSLISFLKNVDSTNEIWKKTGGKVDEILEYYDKVKGYPLVSQFRLRWGYK